MADQKEHTTDELIQKCKDCIYRCLEQQRFEGLPNVKFAETTKTYAETIQTLLSIKRNEGEKNGEQN